MIIAIVIVIAIFVVIVHAIFGYHCSAIIENWFDYHWTVIIQNIKSIKLTSEQKTSMKLTEAHYMAITVTSHEHHGISNH